MSQTVLDWETLKISDFMEFILQSVYGIISFGVGGVSGREAGIDKICPEARG